MIMCAIAGLVVLVGILTGGRERRIERRRRELIETLLSS